MFSRNSPDGKPPVVLPPRPPVVTYDARPRNQITVTTITVIFANRFMGHRSPQNSGAAQPIPNVVVAARTIPWIHHSVNLIPELRIPQLSSPGAIPVPSFRFGSPIV